MLRLCCDSCVLFRHVVQAFLELSNQIMEELCRLGSLVHDIMLLLLELVIDDANFLALHPELRESDSWNNWMSGGPQRTAQHASHLDHKPVATCIARGQQNVLYAS